MRVTREKAAENRRLIVENAARLFREKGVAAVGVDELAAAAGLSYGGLYSQFGSKDALTAEAMDQAFLAFAERMVGNTDLAAYVAEYLSPEHRDHRGEGCAVSALGGEIPRQTGSVRARFTAGIKRSHERIRSLFAKTRGAPVTQDEAWSTLATMIGALVLARAVDEPELSDRILRAARKSLLPPSDPSRRGPTRS